MALADECFALVDTPAAYDAPTVLFYDLDTVEVMDRSEYLMQMKQPDRRLPVLAVLLQDGQKTAFFLSTVVCLHSISVASVDPPKIALIADENTLPAMISVAYPCSDQTYADVRGFMGAVEAWFEVE